MVLPHRAQGAVGLRALMYWARCFWYLLDDRGSLTLRPHLGCL